MQLQKEREMSDSLLHQMLPSKVAQTLRSGASASRSLAPLFLKLTGTERSLSLGSVNHKPATNSTCC